MVSDLVKWGFKLLSTVLWTFILNTRSSIDPFQSSKMFLLIMICKREVNSHLDELWYKVHVAKKSFLQERAP